MLRLVQGYAGARWRFRRLRGAALSEYQNDRAREIVAYAVRHSPFYRKHYAGHDLNEWRSLPTVDKTAMMANFGTFNTRGIALDEAMQVALRAERDRDFSPTIGGCTVGLSSGTSGHRGLFLVDEEERLRWAGTILARALPDLSRRKVAFFLRSNSNLYQTLGRWIRFRYFDLMMPLGDAIAALNEYQPDVLAAPPSMLALLTAARIRPERVVSVAEVLDPQDEVAIRQAFGAPVHEVYQCTEGLLAITCALGSLHVQEDIVALQFEPAEEGRITPLVTDLRRRTQPIIRYRLNDILTLANDPCRCGSEFRVIVHVEGRSDDICYFTASDGKLRPMFPDALRKMVLLADARIDDYQLFQDRPGQVRIRVKASGGMREVETALRETMATSLAGYGCQPAEIVVEEGLLPLPAEQKRRRVRRMWSDVNP